jgi:hypothetical protein
MPASPVFPEGDYSVSLDLATGAGFIFDGTPRTVVSYTAEADIPFGVAVQAGATAGTCKLGIAGTAGAHPTDFLGIATIDIASQNAHENKYVKGEEVGVLIAGTIVVTQTDSTASAYGGSVGVVVATGAFSSDAATTNPAITGAQWLDATAENALGRIRLIGTPQA